MNTATITFPTADPAGDLVRELNGNRPAAASPIEKLLDYAMADGNKRAKIVACRIRHDIDLLRQLMAISDAEAAAHREVEKAKERLARAKANLATVTGKPVPNHARLAGPNEPAPTADTQTIRAWLIENGYPTADRGRLCKGDVMAYVQAHEGGE
jgi:hypothetical protein